jgi:hypothetical protein
MFLNSKIWNKIIIYLIQVRNQYANEIPEKIVCDSLGIKIADGLGLKTHNSSDMINKK